MPAPGSPADRPRCRHRFVRGLVLGCFPSVLIAGWLAGCATSPAVATEEPILDPVGTYDLSMSSATLVSDGTMVIRGAPGSYRGSFSVGTVSVVIAGVETGVGVLNVHADLPQGRIILRLTGDGFRFAGNWVLGAQRGTITAEKRPPPGGGSRC